jgi:hypothetical protein
MSKIYVGDIGTVIALDCGVDLTMASSLEILVRKPNDEVVNWVATVLELNSVAYATKVNDLDQEGIWKVQSKVTLPDGTWLGDTTEFEVFRSFN